MRVAFCARRSERGDNNDKDDDYDIDMGRAPMCEVTRKAGQCHCGPDRARIEPGR